mgnify:CR=1 FL=1|tara:strand:- start:43 stop:345 length:303 start_codon:yes stop_codon:yes gene_type:complete
MKHIKLFEEFLAEGMFNTFSEVVGYEYDTIAAAFKKLHKDNVISYDKKQDAYLGHRKGAGDAFWKYFKDSSEFHHSEKERDVLGLINAFDMVKKNHPWSK